MILNIINFYMKIEYDKNIQIQKINFLSYIFSFFNNIKYFH